MSVFTLLPTAAVAVLSVLPATAAEFADRVCRPPIDDGLASGLWVAALVVGTVGAAWPGHRDRPAPAGTAVDGDTVAKCLLFPGSDDHVWEGVAAPLLEVDDEVLCEVGDVVPCDGEVVAGAAALDPSAVAGEPTAPILVSAAAHSTVAAGVSVISEWIVVRVTAPVASPRRHG
jgi:K+-transporting ATPase ATPase B chain